MRTNQNNPALEQAPTQRIAVVSAVGNDAQRAALRTTAPGAGHRDTSQGAFSQSYFRAGLADTSWLTAMAPVLE